MCDIESWRAGERTPAKRVGKTNAITAKDNIYVERGESCHHALPQQHIKTRSNLQLDFMLLSLGSYIHQYGTFQHFLVAFTWKLSTRAAVGNNKATIKQNGVGYTAT